MLESKNITLSSYHDLLDEKEKCLVRVIKEKDATIKEREATIMFLMKQLDDERQSSAKLQKVIFTKLEKKSSVESCALDNEVEFTTEAGAFNGHQKDELAIESALPEAKDSIQFASQQRVADTKVHLSTPTEVPTGTIPKRITHSVGNATKDSTRGNPASYPMQHGVAAQQSIAIQALSPMHPSATPQQSISNLLVELQPSDNPPEVPLRGVATLNERQQTGLPTPVVPQPQGSISVQPQLMDIHPLVSNQGQGLYQNRFVRSKPRGLPATKESTVVLEHQSSSIFPKQTNEAPPKVPSRGPAYEARQQSLLCVPPAASLERPPKDVNVNPNNSENPNVFQQCQKCGNYVRCSNFQKHQEWCYKNKCTFNSNPSSII